ncbi:hypothetical protein [Acinetobacter sp. WCHAc010052]|uniref:hypothetical protein n=1 Tax=Acinetobacter sp. WCHAc010052 TaxID=2004647 RepID=UPI000B3CD503|nr:hypothetical protein [Acinetobacter sp. WCHAc010052]AXY60069.1 hypothetical protein CDG61_08530 [Acinetobacter sp. WCHAc010052]
MNKISVYLAGKRLVIFIAWCLVVFPYFFISISSDIIFAPLILLLLVIYLQRPKKNIIIVSFLYGFFIFFPIYIVFLRWVFVYFDGSETFIGCMNQIYNLMVIFLTNETSFNRLIIALLVMPSIYFINLGNRLKQKG